MNTDAFDTKQLLQLYQLASADYLASVFLLGWNSVVDVVFVCFIIKNPD